MPKVKIVKDEMYPVFSITEKWCDEEIELSDKENAEYHIALEEFNRIQDILEAKYVLSFKKRLAALEKDRLRMEADNG